MFHTVIIPSINRPAVLGDTIACVLAQRRPPEQLIISVCQLSDVPPEYASRPEIEVVIARKGLTRQINDAAIGVDSRSTIVTILDDDVELHPDYLAQAIEFLADRKDVAIFDGRCVKDGEIDREAARNLLAAEPPANDVVKIRAAYGCNINVRPALLRDVQFDEALPLYGWLCDMDFAVRCTKFGRCVQYSGCRMVHLQVSSGRISGVRMGYSQIVNAIHLSRKGVLDRREMVLSFWIGAVRNNLVKMLLFDRKKDRLGRLKGNLLGFLTLATGKASPDYIERL